MHRGVLSAILMAAACTTKSDEPRFRTQPVEIRDLTETIESSGRLRPQQRFEVHAPVEGHIVSIEVNPGDAVQAGDVLARLASTSLEFSGARAKAARRAAEGRRAQANLALEQARTELARAQDLHARGQASDAALEAAKAEVLSAVAAVDVASAEVSRAASEYGEAAAALSSTELVAPSDGVVLSGPEALGSQVGPRSAPLFTLCTSLEVLQIEATVGEADVGRLQAGMESRFEVPAFPGRTFRAVVERIGVMAEHDGGLVTFPVLLEAPNPDGVLRAGMSASLWFETARAEQIRVVPEAALRFAPPGTPAASPRTRLFVERDGRAISVTVRPQVSDGALVGVEAAEGALEEGDAVILGFSTRDDLDGPELRLGGGR